MPTAAVELRYDLAPGQAYNGRIRADKSTASLGYDTSTSVEFEVQLVVGERQADRHEMRATINDITVGRATLGMPTGGSPFDRATVAMVEGTQLRFFLTDTGQVTGLRTPWTPTRDSRRVLLSITSALRASFVTLPRADQADDSTPAVRLTGMFRDENTGEDLARLRYSHTDHSTPRHRAKGTVIFSRDGYPARVALKRESRHDLFSTYSEVHAEWSKAPSVRLRADAESRDSRSSHACGSPRTHGSKIPTPGVSPVR